MSFFRFSLSLSLSRLFSFFLCHPLSLVFLSLSRRFSDSTVLSFIELLLSFLSFFPPFHIYYYGDEEEKKPQKKTKLDLEREAKRSERTRKPKGDWRKRRHSRKAPKRKSKENTPQFFRVMCIQAICAIRWSKRPRSDGERTPLLD